MPINPDRYVDVTSSVGSPAIAVDKDLIARFLTTITLIPPGSVLEFTSAADVSNYFTDSNLKEVERSTDYFNFINKQGFKPSKISFARWTSTATPAQIFGDKITFDLDAWTTITNGSFGLTIGGVANTFTALDFSGATDASDVAAILQTAIRTKTGSQWTAATVVWDSMRSSFDFTSGSTGIAVISVQEGATGTHIATTPLGWIDVSPTSSLIICNGAAAQTITNVLTTSTSTNNNFATYLFMDTLSAEDHVEAATWGSLQGVQYEYQVRTPSASASEFSESLIDIRGVSMTLSDIDFEFPEQLPMAVEASTNYELPNATQNYMYQQAGNLTPSVTTDTAADEYDGMRINYYGQTQKSGKGISFYQRGLLCGGATDPLLQNLYANESWLRDAAVTALFNLQLALVEISANPKGKSQILSTLQGVISRALLNGTISVGNKLTLDQKSFITGITNDPLAWQTVQSLGYWVDVIFTTSGSETTAEYTLIYAKDNVVNKILGRHILI